ncbi:MULTISPECIES: putative selenate reductase subunit YgfK [Lonsdalea]|uniref:Selenate reductase subunit YgfK n=2 Tax=Lonsdalea TaxID=1082702 RepID=A0ACD1JAF0_9GAMM|nr:MULTISPECIES: putative selenate reductase subunit YgfK [Lonsdalea]OSM95684.1 putative selenate reductase subunit YgfK [Lonsdalea populi]QPQ23136.1 putative selenate reductase subunit YgfK [Lonsdalea populi]RAT11829.1 putative selenate reductase subunit YgfK [Lonsdalea quercina]RAT21622.1 putative selenate reductase subunit YgfK [Lonsdalea populi]RAT22378.1 putative selenate reductase subunit YgfK [Lonsdalea populi]
MGDVMRPIPFESLLERMFSEYRQSRSIFGIPERQFYRRHPARQMRVFGEVCDTPVGPAAGPHTQLAQNIITAWLTGGSFIELKTVQILDRLTLDKPCIDAEDEGFNTEWSTEFTLAKAADEYLKAWFALWLLECLFAPRSAEQGRSFIFNMSVGYDLKGLQQAPMQTFMATMMGAVDTPAFQRYRRTLAHWVAHVDLLRDIAGRESPTALSTLPDRIPSRLVTSVTLSTMHGCPPDEIEAICRYLLEEKKLHTFVKLNPTLLGYSRVREILDGCGFNYIQLKEKSFLHDLPLERALAMLERLLTLARQQGLGFGVKLTNTLGAGNHKRRLPGEEMYMSGRALFPLSINVAAVLSRHFQGRLPISYSGGASQINIRAIHETGIHPITMATDLLKPGGYLRLAACARELETSAGWEMTSVNVDRLETLARAALTADYHQKSWKRDETIAAGGVLPAADCYVAPCVSACAIHQDIPEYLRLAGAGRYAEALALIYQRNALPAITGHICDHQCQSNCTRLDYDGALNIREIKRIVLEKGWAEYQRRWRRPAGSGSRRPAAVIGAGPAGLATGYFLARAGHPVTVFERERSAGGVVRHIVPRFRIPAEKIRHDIDFIARHGVRFEYGCDGELTIEALRRRGYPYVCVGTGAYRSREAALAGDNTAVWPSFQFLRRFNRQEPLSLGRSVGVIGAGNTAMDCARAALRVPGVERVTVLYRRGDKDMPAWREEVEAARRAGATFRFWVDPERFDADGAVTLRVMQPGEPDAQGRARPSATERTELLHLDALISAIGEEPDYAALARMGIPLAADGLPLVNRQTQETERDNVFLIGDAHSGPASIVAAIGAARRAADEILRRENIHDDHAAKRWLNTDPADIYRRKGELAVSRLGADAPEAFARQEAQRCLSCNYVCAKCVDVCPNRANVSIAVPGFRDRFQTLHIDAYCNECGNCAQFCPWDGKPYRDKVTLFNLRQDFAASRNPGFLLDGDGVLVRHEQRIYRLAIDPHGAIADAPPALADLCRVITTVYRDHHYLLGGVEE